MHDYVGGNMLKIFHFVETQYEFEAKKYSLPVMDRFCLILLIPILKKTALTEYNAIDPIN